MAMPVELESETLGEAWLLVAREILDGDQLGAVDLSEQENAGIDRLIDEPAIMRARQHDRAGAAITLGATLLGAGRALLQPDPVEQGVVLRRAFSKSEASAVGDSESRLQ